MAKIAEISEQEIALFRKKLEQEIKSCLSIEATAQKITDVVYQQFQDSISLVRVFVTVPFEKLPRRIQDFARKLAVDKGVDALVNKQTLVFTLMGTRGEEPDWNDCSKSKNHLGIPLVSAKFIELIPMMSRLLKSMGLSIDWITSGDAGMVAKAIGSAGGIFYIADSGNAINDKGEKIIAAQDFVEKYKIKTIFGTGGSGIFGSTFLVIIIFTREYLDRAQVEKFMFLADTLASVTKNLIPGTEDLP